MAKFFGAIGYVEGSEDPPGSGVYKQVAVEYDIPGDVLERSVAQQIGEKVNDDLSSGNSISVVLDAYAREHYFAIKYVNWEGVRWRVAETTVAYPRLVMRLGGVYSGPTPPTSESP